MGEGKRALVVIPGLFAGFPTHLRHHAFLRHAKQLGYRADAILPPSYNTGPADEAVEYIGTELENRYGEEDTVCLVGHSRGALLSLQLLATHPSSQLVDSVVTLAAPYQGANVARLLAWRYDACRELVPGSDYLRRFSEMELPVEKIAANIFSPQDSVVTKESATPSFMPPAKNIELHGLKHNQLLTSKDIARRTTEILRPTPLDPSLLYNQTRLESDIAEA